MTVVIPTGEPEAPELPGFERLKSVPLRYRVRSLLPREEAAWRILYRQFAEHYQVPVLPESQTRVWQWLMDTGYPLRGIVAENQDGDLCGLAHFRAFPRPINGTNGCFLDDLLVDRKWRGSGVADALMHSLRAIALHEGWTVIRWITADNNFRARSMYDSYALRTMWVTYDMDPYSQACRVDRTDDTLDIRPLATSDRDQWRDLYAQYLKHYRLPVRREHQDTIWAWIHDPDQPIHCLVAESADRQLLGLAHFRPFARPLAASEGAFLDDLVVDRQARGGGAVDALLQGVRSVARDRGWTVIRWITADDNHRARSVYDQYATRTMWLIYDMTPGEIPDELKEVFQ